MQLDPWWEGFGAGVLSTTLLVLLYVFGRHSFLPSGWPWAPHQQASAAEPPEEPQKPLRATQDVAVIPRFGEPVATIYNPAHYAEVLRCSSGVVCKGRELEPGEMFWMIPPPLGGELDPFIVVCADDVVMQEVLADG